MQTESLKPCPCGKTPERLHCNEGGSFRYRDVSGDCGCGWEIEVRVTTMRKLTDDELYAECVEEWNAMPRSPLSNP